MRRNEEKTFGHLHACFTLKMREIDEQEGQNAYAAVNAFA